MSHINIKADIPNIMTSQINEEPEEIHYIYDENTEMITASSDNLNGVTDIILDDGTRAMVFNGTLITADGQTLILQEDNSNHCIIDENSGHLILSNDQEQQLFDTVTSHSIINSDIVQIVQDDGKDNVDDSQQVIFLQEDGLPVQINIKGNGSNDYELAEISNEVPMKMVQIKTEQEQLEGVIDLEQLLNQQGVMPVEGGNYQYAVLKDGKFHIQSLDHIFGIDDILTEDTRTTEPSTLPQELTLNSTYEDFSNLSAIKGRNLLTGQPITLSKYMDKMQQFKLNEYDVKRGVKENKIRTSTSQESPLKKLINKKIPLCRTGRGKLLVGKIINVTKKSESTKNDNNENTVSVNKERTNPIVTKKTINPANSAIKKPSKLIDSAGKVSNNTKALSTRALGKPLEPNITIISNGTISHVKQNQTDDINSISPVCTKVIKSSDTLEGLLETSKIVVQKKFVTKDCFSVITRTLCGLMNMDSVVKKLRNKTIILKVLEKTYDHSVNDYKKSVSYCSGYMVREYKLNEEENNFSESWKFIPDANSKDIILGGAVFEADKEDSSTLKKSVNITIQITVHPEGNRSSRVIINPPNMYKYKQNPNSPKSYFSCENCPMKFSNEKAKDDHVKLHGTENIVPTHTCSECDKKFMSPFDLEKHINTYCKPIPCRYCSERPSNTRLLRKHLLTHFKPSQTEKQDSIDSSLKNEEKRAFDQKIFFCDICGRQFSRHSNLQRHIEIHKGEGAMFKCTICSCSYHYVSSLTRHILSCHLDTTKRPHLFKNDKTEGEGNTLPQYELIEDSNITEVIPLEDISDSIQYEQDISDSIQYEQDISDNIQYEHVNIDIDDVEQVPNGIEILRIPMDQSFIVEN